MSGELTGARAPSTLGDLARKAADTSRDQLLAVARDAMSSMARLERDLQSGKPLLAPEVSSRHMLDTREALTPIADLLAADLVERDMDAPRWAGRAAIEQFVRLCAELADDLQIEVVGMRDFLQPDQYRTWLTNRVSGIATRGAKVLQLAAIELNRVEGAVELGRALTPRSAAIPSDGAVAGWFADTRRRYPNRSDSWFAKQLYRTGKADPKVGAELVGRDGTLRSESRIRQDVIPVLRARHAKS